MLRNGDVFDERGRFFSNGAQALLRSLLVDSSNPYPGLRRQRTTFGVFDGHGGKFIARKCSEHCWVDEEDIEGRFWKLDETLGPQSLSSGTTASIMVIDHVHGEDFSITLAWVGDSQIMEIDVPLPSPVSVENQPQCKHT